jgi:hypothetical protein
MERVRHFCWLGGCPEIWVGTTHRNAVDAITGATDEHDRAVAPRAAAPAASWAGRSAALRAAHYGSSGWSYE